MKIRKLLQLGSALVVSLSSLLVISMPMAHAAGPFLCTWTGGGSDDNFSTAANWSGCNSAAPQPLDGDNLVFPYSGITNFSPNNDLTNASFTSITFSGSPGLLDIYELTGNALALTSGVSVSATGNQPLVIINLPVVESGILTFNVADSSALLVLADTFGGAAGTSLIGAGTLDLAGDNVNYTGQFTATSGRLVAGSSNALGPSIALGAIVNSGADFTISCAVTDNFNSKLTLTGNSTLTIGDYPAPKLGSGTDCGSSLSSTEFGVSSVSGNINLNGDITLGSDITFGAGMDTTTITGALTGAHSITMLPGYTGKLVVASSNNTSNTANGTYTSAQFTKTLSDSQPAQDVDIFGNNVITLDGTRASTNVWSGGLLMGTGNAGDLFVDTGGTVAPGHSPGCMSTGDLTLAGTFQAEIGGTTACTGYDQLTVTGTVDVTGGTLSPTLYNGFVPVAGQSYTVISNDGVDPVTGTFTGLAEGATITSQGVTYRVTYTGGDGNDVVLTVVGVNASQLPAKPNTGFTLVSAHPLASLVATTAAALTLVGIARRMKPVSVRK